MDGSQLVAFSFSIHLHCFSTISLHLQLSLLAFQSIPCRIYLQKTTPYFQSQSNCRIQQPISPKFNNFSSQLLLNFLSILPLQCSPISATSLKVLRYPIHISATSIMFSTGHRFAVVVGINLHEMQPRRTNNPQCYSWLNAF